MSDFAINIEHISKVYKLYRGRADRLKDALHLTRRQTYQDYYALSDVNFTVQKGETVGLIGTNGAGKSTLLKIVTGVLTPSGGQVEVNGRISALLELGAGFNNEYTGLENIYFNGTLLGYTREQMEERVPRIIEFAGIGDYINQPVKMYSSGMFARLAFAMAINVEPDILIVDEALSVGDIYFQSKCFKKMDEIKKNGTTVLLVTHDMSSVVKYCDRVVVLNHGKVVTVEEHSIIGGLGGAVAEVLAEKAPTKMLRIGVMDTFGESGPAKALIEKYGLDAKSIYEKVKAFCK